MKSCFMFGHADCPDTMLPKIEEAIVKCYSKEVTAFYVGSRGRFDSLAASAVKQVKQQHPDIKLYLLLAYHPGERAVNLTDGFDGSYYPPSENVPRPYAIVRGNQYMVDNSDYAEEKHQYDISEVWANFDFNARIERWKSNFSFSHIMKDILDGKITEKNYTKYISGDLYAQHRAKIESAFAFCRDKNKTLNRNMDVIMIYGPGGVGKTTYAKMLAESKGFDTSDIFVSSSGEDILCGYRGEGCIIIDDFRKEQMTFVEFLKMTDNNTNSSVRSRYTNKNISNCKLMIVTSIFPLEKLFVGNNGEDMVQLYRRFKLQLKVDAATITPYAYVKSIKSFLPTSVSYPNPVQQLVIASQTTELRTDQDVFNFLCVAVSPATATKTFEERGEEQKNNNN